MGKHRTCCDVTDRINMGNRSLLFVVNRHKSFLVRIDPGFFKAELSAIRGPAHSDQHLGKSLCSLLSLLRGKENVNAVFLILYRGDCRVLKNIFADLLHSSLQGPDQLTVHRPEQFTAHGEAYLAAQGGIYLAQLKADIAATDHQERFRQLGKLQGGGRVRDVAAGFDLQTGWKNRR